jgi:hypothetical protein
MEKVLKATGTPKQAGVGVLISDFKLKSEETKKVTSYG